MKLEADERLKKDMPVQGWEGAVFRVLGVSLQMMMALAKFPEGP